MEIGNIVKGNINRLLGLNKNLYEERIKICKRCPLYKLKFGEEICNHKLYLNPKTNDVSTEQKDGYIKGCGCLLKSKTPILEAHCPVDKW